MVWDSERAAQSGSFCIEMKGVEVRFTSITTRWKVELFKFQGSDVHQGIQMAGTAPTWEWEKGMASCQGHR